MHGLLRLPTGSTIIENNLLAKPPYTHAQRLVAIELPNGVLIEGIWDDHAHLATLTAYEPGDGAKGQPICRRPVPIAAWLPAMTSSLAWTVLFEQPETCQGTKAE
jgi:hypothetical protein